uniref:DUF4005 domain-containing protein n=1 Tax=Strongyloides papillosus TaxID=174720 RepID=A0A0N5CIE2_STREA
MSFRLIIGDHGQADFHRLFFNLIMVGVAVKCVAVCKLNLMEQSKNNELVKFSLPSGNDTLPGVVRRRSSQKKSHSPSRLTIKDNGPSMEARSPGQLRRVDTLRQQLNVGRYAPKSRPVSAIRLPERQTGVRMSQKDVKGLERKPSITESIKNSHGLRKYSNPTIGQPNLQKPHRGVIQPFKRNKSCRGWSCFG